MNKFTPVTGSEFHLLTAVILLLKFCTGDHFNLVFIIIYTGSLLKINPFPQMSQRRDRLGGEDTLSHLAKTWIDSRESHMDIPTSFVWPHAWHESWKHHKIVCCKHFGLDLNAPENTSKFSNLVG
jgi:hypothetical protein